MTGLNAPASAGAFVVTSDGGGRICGVMDRWPTRAFDAGFWPEPGIAPSALVIWVTRLDADHATAEDLDRAKDATLRAIDDDGRPWVAAMRLAVERVTLADVHEAEAAHARREAEVSEQHARRRNAFPDPLGAVEQQRRYTAAQRTRASRHTRQALKCRSLLVAERRPVAPAARPRGAGRPRLRVVRSSARSADSGPSEPGGGDPPSPPMLFLVDPRFGRVNAALARFLWQHGDDPEGDS